MKSLNITIKDQAFFCRRASILLLATLPAETTWQRSCFLLHFP